MVCVMEGENCSSHVQDAPRITDLAKPRRLDASTPIRRVLIRVCFRTSTLKLRQICEIIQLTKKVESINSIMAPGILVSDDHIMEDAPSSSDELENPSDSPPPFPVGDPPSDGSDKENRKAALEDMFDDDEDDDEFLSSAVEATEGQKFVLRALPQRC
jgi:hypothetical protein